MKLSIKWGAAAIALAISVPGAAQQPSQIGAAPVTLSGTPYLFDTAEQHGIKVTVLAKGMARPFAIEFLPGGDLLVSERGGGLRIIRAATTPGSKLGFRYGDLVNFHIQTVKRRDALPMTRDYIFQESARLMAAEEAPEWHLAERVEAAE